MVSAACTNSTSPVTLRGSEDASSACRTKSFVTMGSLLRTEIGAQNLPMSYLTTAFRFRDTPPPGFFYDFFRRSFWEFLPFYRRICEQESSRPAGCVCPPAHALQRRK